MACQPSLGVRLLEEEKNLINHRNENGLVKKGIRSAVECQMDGDREIITSLRHLSSHKLIYGAYEELR